MRMAGAHMPGGSGWLISAENARKWCAAAAAAGIAMAVAGCTTSQNTGPATAALPSAPVAPQVTIVAADLVGDWGLASYRNEADRPRTEAEARSACNNPYKVGAGANGGVMMYLADQPQLSEVFIKTTGGGQVFIGPQGPPGLAQDRVVLSFENNVLVTDWLDPGVKERYGTMIFVRCGVA